MKVLQSSFFRALAAMAVGALLIKYPDNTVTGITMVIGILFLLSGVVSVLAYLQARRHMGEYKIYDAEGRLIAGQKPVLPIVGIGSMVLGGMLAMMPATFVSALMYVIGGILVLGAIGQFLSIMTARRYGKVSLFYWVCPTAILLVGLYVIIKPMEPLKVAMLILGWLTLFYGVVEAVNGMVFGVIRRRWEKEQARILEEEERRRTASEDQEQPQPSETDNEA